MKNKKNYQVCVRCVMDTTDPDIIFDASGVCNHCHEYEETKAMFTFSPEEATEKLDAIVEKVITRLLTLIHTDKTVEDLILEFQTT